MILKTSNKSVWSNVFWHVEVCIFWKCIQYNIHWDKTQIFKKFPSDTINGTKNALFFLFRAPTHHSFNLWFLYELKHKVCFSKTVWYFPVPIPFRFYLSLYFCSTKWMDFLTLNIIIPFKIKIIENSRTVLLPHLWFLSCIKKFYNSMIPAWVGALQKLTKRQIF